MPSRFIKSVGSRVVSLVGERFISVVRGVAFWTAVLLPLLYIPLVLFDHSSITDVWFLGKVVTVNVAAIVVGHGYGSPKEFDRT